MKHAFATPLMGPALAVVSFWAQAAGGLAATVPGQWDHFPIAEPTVGPASTTNFTLAVEGKPNTNISSTHKTLDGCQAAARAYILAQPFDATRLAMRCTHSDRFTVEKALVVPAAIETQPFAVQVTAPGPATFSVAALGTDPVLQWFRDGMAIPGATGLAYTVDHTSVMGDNGAKFSVGVANASGRVISVEVVLDVRDPPVDHSMLGPDVDRHALPAPGLGTDLFRVTNTTEEPAAGGGAFRVPCDFSHVAFDDPIVHPGMPGMSHGHTYFGNTSTDAFSTYESLRAAPRSTCRGGTANKSAYWAPGMVNVLTHIMVRPNATGNYYKNGHVKAPTIIQTIPTGLRLVAGTASNTAPKGPFRFNCQGGDKSGGGWVMSIPNCQVGQTVVMAVTFPQCWDGVNLDSPNHKTHVVYHQKSICPATHPVPIVQFTMNVHYPVTKEGESRDWRLTSDAYGRSADGSYARNADGSFVVPGGYSAHADLFEAWDPEIRMMWTRNCNQALRDCHSHLLGEGKRIIK